MAPRHTRHMTDFAIRLYVPETDLSPLSRMLTEVEAHDRDGDDPSEEFLRRALEWPNYHPAEGVWVAEQDGALVGYAVTLEQPSRRNTVYVAVHPAARRNGLGSRLLDLALGRAGEVGSTTILVYANEHNAASRAFVASRGFAPVGTSGILLAPPELSAPHFDFPAGFVLKQFSEVNDPQTLAVALHECYLGMWGHQQSEKPDGNSPNVIRFLSHYGAYNIVLLFDAAGAVSGINSMKPEGGKGPAGETVDILDGPGVIRKYREQGLQRPMVLATLAHLRKQGQRAVRLEFWGDEPETVRMYQELGFALLNVYVCFHKELR